MLSGLESPNSMRVKTTVISGFQRDSTTRLLLHPNTFASLSLFPSFRNQTHKRKSNPVINSPLPQQNLADLRREDSVKHNPPSFEMVSPENANWISEMIDAEEYGSFTIQGPGFSWPLPQPIPPVSRFPPFFSK